MSNLLNTKVIEGRLLCDVELILNGAFNPLTGFLNENDYLSVINNNRLANGSLWPMPIVYRINESEKSSYMIGSHLTLTDKTNLPLANFHIESIYKPDRIDECEKVLGSSDDNHPYVKEILEGDDIWYIGGRLEKINLPYHFDFNELRKTPEQVRKEIVDKRLKKVVGFQTRNPMHKCHFELVKYAMSIVEKNNPDVNVEDIGCLVHPVVGVTQACDINYECRVKCYKKIMPHFPKGRNILSLLPLSMRMAGPREAMLHALIRKNYGCTHFIVGRDHAGPSYNKKNGDKFYGPYEAHQLLSIHEKEIGIEIILSKAISYIKELGCYKCEGDYDSSYKPQHISGTEQRKLLKEGKDIPTWFSFPEVVSELKKEYTSNSKKGFCIYLVGLSGSGKSFIASKLEAKLREYTDRKVTLLDGDIVRQHLSKGLGFSREDRSTNVQRIGYVASEIVKHGGICVCSNIAPYNSDRLLNRENISKYGGYFEIFVTTQLETCENRDVKGLYKLAREGKIKEFTGISDPFEIPTQCDLALGSYTLNDVEKNTNSIVDLLKEKEYLK